MADFEKGVRIVIIHNAMCCMFLNETDKERVQIHWLPWLAMVWNQCDS